MRISYLKICALIASSGFHGREIAEFAEEALQSGPKKLIRDVMRLRERVDGITLDQNSDTAIREHDLPPSDVDIKIERLLIQDAGLARAVAVKQLTSMIQSRFPDIELPEESRKGFRVWIRKIAKLIPEKELLHLASSLRNRMVHEEPSAWRLK